VITIPSEAYVTNVLSFLTEPVPEGLPRPGAQEALTRFQRIIASDNVVGVGVAQKVRAGRPLNRLAATFYVRVKRPSLRVSRSEIIPTWIPSVLATSSAVATDVVELGDINPQVNGISPPVNVSGQIRPGYSISRIDSSPGSLGAIVRLRGSLAVLSNSHVLALSGRGRIGDGILYPGRQDGGSVPASLIGTLAAFSPFTVGGGFVNQVDCAAGLLLASVANRVVPTIHGIGPPVGTVRPQRGMNVV
jgi:hypothetical protein